MFPCVSQDFVNAIESAKVVIQIKAKDRSPMPTEKFLIWKGQACHALEAIRKSFTFPPKDTKVLNEVIENLSDIGLFEDL